MKGPLPLGSLSVADSTSTVIAVLLAQATCYVGFWAHASLLEIDKSALTEKADAPTAGAIHDALRGTA